MTTQVLVVEDHEESRKMLLSNLRVEGISAVSVPNAEEAILLLQKENFALILSDLKLPGKSGVELLQEVKKQSPSTFFIMMTAYGDIATAVHSIRDQGANDFVEKPLDLDILIHKITQFLRIHQLEEENRKLKQSNLPSFIGETPSIQSLRQQIDKISQISLKPKVLILGESGTGKEVVARRIHTLSPQHKGPFVAVNCSAIPDTLWESEMFGHVKEAFTGANSDREGYFQQAHRGTLFLDEIGDIPLLLQSKLLRTIESGEVTRLGSNHPEKIDIQIISATNVDLVALIEKEKFRKDLFYRLNGIQITLPPLRERLEDIPLLVDYFFTQHGFSYEMALATLKKLQEHSWPGNVRELFNALQNTLTFLPTSQKKIEPHHLRFIQHTQTNETTTENTASVSYPETKSLKEIREYATSQAESRHIKNILEKNQWNRSRAAKQLQISYKTLLEKIKGYHLTPPDFIED